MASVYERDHVLVDAGTGFAEGEQALIGHNIEGVIAELEKRMRTAAADLEFEEAARLRDEIKRLEQSDLGLPVPGGAPSAPPARSAGRSSAGRAGQSGKQYARAKAKARKAGSAHR